MHGKVRVVRSMKTAVVVGTGAGGATAARELQGRFQVTMLEAGRPFTPFSMSMRNMERLKRARLLLSHRQISLFFPPMRVAIAADGMKVIIGRCVGGTTTLSTGNAIRADKGLRALGIDLDEEFQRLERELPIGIGHRSCWKPVTRELWNAFSAEGVDPSPMPKVGDYDRCIGCGRCVFGCPRGVKWDSRSFVAQARSRGTTVKTGWCVRRVDIRNGEARGVWARRGPLVRFFPADVVILAAGGLGTPRILERSGVRFDQRLFVDPVLCVAARRGGAAQHAELPMPFYAERDGCMLSPYFDYMSYLFDAAWPAAPGEIISIMIKLADAPVGSVHARLNKTLNESDRRRLEHAADVCSSILERLGLPPEGHFRGMVTAGHPGGTVPLSASDAQTLHPGCLPGNLFVADASLFPDGLGAPPMLTIIA
ncbi:MAG: GMC family oxidoreductase N-terminal domain-containing protein [Candidatus Eisenbacteria bacterium]|nr:GMC family oxidoreductase N-terminal domain-containing protein [Candidatus Eisenbacteria bacterium]